MTDKKSSSKETRTRTWTIVVYPESAPEQWRTILDELHIEWIESPLHDSDLNADGEPKKAHWHVLLIFSGVKSFEQVKEITDSIHAPIPQRCHNARAMVRYFAHLDNPEKKQYSIADIVGHGGADVSELLKPSMSERYSLIAEMIDFVQENSIVEFKDLVNYARLNMFDTWFPLLCDSSSYILNQYIKSQRHSRSKPMISNTTDTTTTIKIDSETGEVLNCFLDCEPPRSEKNS